MTTPATTTAAPVLRLKQREERRIRAGHLWVFSNEVDARATPLKAFEPGQVAALETSGGQFLGWVYVNPNSLICARLVGRRKQHAPGVGLLTHRLKVALALRERYFRAPYYRLAYAESDGLPGLVVDRYDDILVAQVTTAGMEAMRDDIVEALTRVVRPRGILWNNTAYVRRLEGLDDYVAVADGDVPESLMLEEGGARFPVSVTSGQKTGWFYDQRENRARVAALSGGMRVLDACCYLGGFGVQAAVHGAASVTFLDSSADALERAEAACEASGVACDTDFVRADVFDGLAALRADSRRFDIVVLDPPAFIRRRKDMKAGRVAYRRLNERGMQLLERDALLVSCSCSHFLTGADLLGQVNRAARHLDRQLQLVHHGGQDSDHPVHPVIPETRYLDTLFCRVTRD